MNSSIAFNIRDVSFAGAVLDRVELEHGGVLSVQSDARSVTEPETTAVGLLLSHKWTKRNFYSQLGGMPGASQSFADARNPETMIAMVLRPEVAALTRKDHRAASGDVTRLVGSGKARAGEAVNEIDCPMFDLGRGRSKTMKRAGISLLILAAYASLAAADTNDYPTETRADYVFVCMKTNGETPDILRRCSCSIDVIASLLPYDHYVAAQTVASMNQVQGQIGTMFRASEQSKAMLADLHRAEAEAEIRCF